MNFGSPQEEAENRASRDAYPVEVNASTLTEVVCTIVNSNFDMRQRDPKSPMYPILILGEAGVGKTELVQTFARTLAQRRSEPVHTRFLYLSTQDQADLIGMPYIEDGKTHYARPDWFPDEDSEDCWIICADEFNRGAPYVQQTMLPFSLQGILHTHTLPTKSVVIFLCNPPSDKYHVSHFQDTAMFDRMARFSYAPSLDEWINHSKRVNIHDAVIKAALQHKDKLISNEHVPHEDTISVEPSNRTFTKLGLMLNTLTPEWIDCWGDVLCSAFVGTNLAIPIMKQVRGQCEKILTAHEILNQVEEHLDWLKSISYDEIYEAGKFDVMNDSLIHEIISVQTELNAEQMKNLTKYLEFLGGDQYYQFSHSLNSKMSTGQIPTRERAKFFRELDFLSNGKFNEKIKQPGGIKNPPVVVSGDKENIWTLTGTSAGPFATTPPPFPGTTTT